MASVICTNTLSAIQASCDALKRQGGIDSRIWLGSIADIASVTLDANGQIDTFTLGASKFIYPYQGKKLTNNAQAELTVSENGPSTFTHTVNATLFPVTGAQMKSVENLLLAGGPMFAIIERKGTGSASNNGFEIYGLSWNPFKEAIETEDGLLPSAGTYQTGTALTDSTGTVIALSGVAYNLPKMMFAADDYAAALAAIEALED
jgi:hypothetical protein